jgi:hypothetical protein
MTDLDKVHEKELIELICLKVNKIGEKLASYVTENFDTLDEFLNAESKEFEQITDMKNRSKLKPEQITGILEQKKDIPKKLSVRETAFFVLAKTFLEGNVNNLQNLKLDSIEINPFLAKALGLKSSKEIISFNVYQAVTRSIVTSWGMMVENFLIYAGSEKNKEKFTTKEGSNPDLKKRTKNGMEYFQIKSGPNTMNVSMVHSLNDVFAVLNNKNLKCYLGMTYGKRDRISAQIKSNLNDFDNTTLIGKELWDHISEEKNYHKKVIKAMTVATSGMLEKSFIEMINDKIMAIDNQWKEKFGSKSLENIFDSYL